MSEKTQTEKFIPKGYSSGINGQGWQRCPTAGALFRNHGRCFVRGMTNRSSVACVMSSCVHVLMCTCGYFFRDEDQWNHTFESRQQQINGMRSDIMKTYTISCRLVQGKVNNVRGARRSRNRSSFIFHSLFALRQIVHSSSAAVTRRDHDGKTYLQASASIIITTLDYYHVLVINGIRLQLLQFRPSIFVTTVWCRSI